MMRLLRLGVAGIVGAIACAALGAVPADDEIEALIRQLGDPDYGRRETAAARLDALGAAAVDHLLAAAETSDDLEVALRAGWLVETIPLDNPADTAEVKTLLDGYKSKPLPERVVIMHRLLRLDDDAGIAPLARIVRLDREPAASRVAAALLVREWSPGDPYWPGMADRIATAISGSGRPASRLLNSLVEFARSAETDVRERALATAREMVEALDHARPADGGRASGDDADEQQGPVAMVRDIGAVTQKIFTRCLVQMLVDAGRVDEATGIVRDALAARLDGGKDEAAVVAEVADMLAWAAGHGVPGLVDGMPPESPAGIVGHPVVRYAMALCERAGGKETEAERVARSAFEAAGGDFGARLRAAMLLVKWGAGDWASREYAAIIDDDAAPAGEFVLAAVMFSEFLHDRGRDGEAAGVLRKMLAADEVNRNPILQQFGRDPGSTRARMAYFESCDAASRSDTAAQRLALEAATGGASRDVDALIALHRLTEGSPEQRKPVIGLISEELRRMEEEIKQTPDDMNACNEYAWLVANTEGDVPKAIRFSKQSLRESFDNPSYLDTLAHCLAAAGKVPAAIRTQRLAMRHEPHNRIIRLNLEAFERRAAAAGE